MTDSTPNFITESQFNQAVNNWSIRIRDKMRRNAPVGEDSLPDDEKLAFIKSSVRENYGTASKIQFSFERHGVFVHYGVGRGYVHQGNQVVRGRKLNKTERLEKYNQGHTRSSVDKMKHGYASGAIKRRPVDWFDVEIRRGIKDLANIAQEFYGDKVLSSLLKQIDKAIIEKK
ncbi:MAG: hypothetical protein LBK58_03055 [Prevotellaceae bacterium]|jgi:hypothetical protein|nr:hypothetical protein [Prevotellaceae bacterium]